MMDWEQLSAEGMETDDLFSFGECETFTGLTRPEHAGGVVNVSIVRGWTYILLEAGSLTIQENFRCTSNLSLHGRHGIWCSSTTLAVSSSDPSTCFIDLAYETPFLSSASCHDSLIVSCDEKSITSHVLPSTGAAPIMSALWINQHRVLLGTSNMECLIVTLEDSWRRSSRGGVRASVKRLVLQEQYLQEKGLQVCCLGFIAGATESGQQGHGNDHLPAGLLVSSSSELMCFQASVNQRTAIQPSWTLESMEAGHCIHPAHLAVAPLSSTTVSQCQRVAWLTESFIHLLEIPVPENTTLSARSVETSAIFQKIPVLVPYEENQSVRSIEISTVQIIDAAKAGHAISASGYASATEGSAPLTGLPQFTADAVWYRSDHSTQRTPSGKVAARRTQCGAHRCISVAMTRWHALVLVSLSGKPGAVVIMSHVTGAIVQVLHTPAAVGQPLFVRVDNQPSSMPPTASSVLLITDAPVDRAVVFGTQGFCALTSTHEADCLCKDLVTAGMYDQVHMHLEQRILYKNLNAGFQKSHPGSAQCTSEMHGCEDFLFQKRMLQAAQGRVRLVQATDFCSRGDYLGAASALGTIPADVAVTSGLPDFRELALWFQDNPEDPTYLSQNKACGLLKYLACRLQKSPEIVRDAASCICALWLMDMFASEPNCQGLSGDQCRSLGDLAPIQVSRETYEARQAINTSPVKNSVLDLVTAYKDLLPYAAVEQILLACGCREDLKRVAKLYNSWHTVLNLAIEERDVSSAFSALASLHSDHIPGGLSTIFAAHPISALMSVTEMKDQSVVTPQLVSRALGGFVQPDMCHRLRKLLAQYLKTVINDGDRTPIVHEMYVTVLILSGFLKEYVAFYKEAVQEAEENRKPGSAAVASTSLQKAQKVSFGRGSGNGAQERVPNIHNYLFDPHRALRLAKHSRCTAEVRMLHLELQEHQHAVLMSETFEDGISVAAQVQGPLLRQLLLAAALRKQVKSASCDSMCGNALSTTQSLESGPLQTQHGHHVGTDGVPSNIEARLQQLHPLITASLQKGILLIEEVMKILPKHKTFRICKKILVTYMQCRLTEVENAVHRTHSVVVTSQALESRLLHTQCRHAALCWDDKCIICHMPLYSGLGIMKEEPPGIRKSQVSAFSCGGIYHTSCLRLQYKKALQPVEHEGTFDVSGITDCAAVSDMEPSGRCIVPLDVIATPAGTSNGVQAEIKPASVSSEDFDQWDLLNSEQVMHLLTLDMDLSITGLELDLPSHAANY